MPTSKHLPEYLTATIMDWQYLLKPFAYKMMIINQLKRMVEFEKVAVYAFCIMDNHIHLIWQVLGENKPSEMQRQLFEHTAKAFKADLLVNNPTDLEKYKSTQADRAYQFWKRRPLGIQLFTPEVFEQKLEYIHQNPVEAGLCSLPEQYEFSSAGFYKGMIDKFELLSCPY